MARLTVHPPNHKPSQRNQEEVGFARAFWIIFAVIGFAFTIFPLATGEGAFLKLFVLLLFVIVPLLQLYHLRMEKYYQDYHVSNVAHCALQDQLNERLRTHLLKKHGGILTKEYAQPASDEEEKSEVTGLISDKHSTR